MRLFLKCLVIATVIAIGSASLPPCNSAKAEQGSVIRITAKRYEYNPNRVILKKGMPVTLELTSLDRIHGFNCPDLAIRTDILPGKTSIIRFTPAKTGIFPFHCDIFCGEGHETMAGEFIVGE